MSKFSAFKNLSVPALLLLGAGFSQGGDCAEGGVTQFICGISLCLPLPVLDCLTNPV